VLAGGRRSRLQSEDDTTSFLLTVTDTDRTARISARRLAAALATRLSAVVPAPIRVIVEEPASSTGDPDVHVIVRVLDGAEPWSGQGFSDSSLVADEGDSPLDVAADTAIVILSGVQDSVSRILRDPWPRLPTDAMAMPAGRADEQGLYLWFGLTEDTAAVRLTKIELAEIASSFR
jgi:hypothetical protein